MSVLHSPRLDLRRLQMSDLPAMIELETNPQIVRFTPRRFPLSPDQIRERLQSFLDQAPAREPFGIWGAFLRTTDVLASWYMLMPTGKEFPELGYMTPERHWGHGYTTEGARCLIDHAFRDLQVKGVLALTDPDNLGSKKVLEKLGFIWTAEITQQDKVLQREITLDQFLLRAP